MRFLVALLLAVPMLAGCLADVVGNGQQAPIGYLSDEKYKTWLIEVDYDSRLTLNQGVLGNVEKRLSPLVYKDDVGYSQPKKFDTNRDTWSVKQLQDLSREHREHTTSGSTITTHLLFVDGQFTQSDSVVGLAIGWDLIVIFQGRIEDGCSGVLTLCTSTPRDILEAVTTHEFGHIMGLVHREGGNGDIPVPKQSDHEDADHPGHSNNRNSVMYWAVESRDVFNFFNGGVPKNFDSADRADLCAAGGRCG